MLQQLFATLENFPSHSQSLPSFYYILLLLLMAFRDSTTSLSLRVARDVVVQRIPTVVRERKSISLALALAQGAVELGGWNHFNLTEIPFVTIDKVILEIWSEQEDVEGWTEENLRKWKRFRSDVMSWRHFNLADLNGPLPTWHPSGTRTGPSKLDRLLSVFGINRVCVSRALQYVSHS